jgi:hypothetical protein
MVVFLGHMNDRTLLNNVMILVQKDKPCIFGTLTCSTQALFFSSSLAKFLGSINNILSKILMNGDKLVYKQDTLRFENLRICLS